MELPKPQQVIALTPGAYERLYEQAGGNSLFRVDETTTPAQLGFQLGALRVLEYVRRGFTTY